VDKYRDKKIKSVIHFRRIMEGYDLSEDDPPTREKLLRRVEEFFLNPKLETREAFDEFVVEKKRVQSALAACEDFLQQLQRYKLTYTTDDNERNALRKALHQVREYCKSLERALEGSDDPEAKQD
jgi:predicted  nucleic acid-binding Zn-ribbon protein